jgi:hypothetical protein
VIGPEALHPLVAEILRHTLDGRPALAGSLLDVVVEHGDSADLFGVCCAAAETARDALQVLFPDAGTGPGQEWQLPPDTAQAMAGDPHRLFAARFVTACLNGDHGMAVALFQASETAGSLARTESVCALLAHAYRLTLHARQGPAAPTPGGVPS